MNVCQFIYSYILFSVKHLLIFFPGGSMSQGCFFQSTIIIRQKHYGERNLYFHNRVLQTHSICITIYHHSMRKQINSTPSHWATHTLKHTNRVCIRATFSTKYYFSRLPFYKGTLHHNTAYSIQGNQSV